MEKKLCPIHDTPKMPNETNTNIFFGPRGVKVTDTRDRERCTCDNDDDNQNDDDLDTETKNAIHLI